jgi:hypothetical protein
VCALDCVDAVEEVDAVDALLVLRLAVFDEDEVAACSISSSRALEADFVAVDVAPFVAAVAVELGACAANHAPRPRNDAALTAPVMRRARRAGCGFGVLMVGACARCGKSI